MKILMVGAGAIGGITAALIKEKGYNITLLCKYPELANLINEKGFHIFGYCGDHRIKLPAVSNAEELSGTFDIVFIATKAYDLKKAAISIIPLLKSESRVVSMQNGIVEEELAKIVGTDRTVGCMVGFGATLIEPGVAEMTSKGEMIVGYLNQGADQILSEIARVLGSVVPTSVSDKILSHLYSKLIINAASSTLGALTGLTLGKLLGNTRARKIFMCIIKEAMDVADAMRLTVVPYGGKLNWYKLIHGPRWRANLIISIVGIKYRRLKSSSLQSLERGKKTEVDIFNGYISEKGREHGTQTPVNDLLVRMVHEIENKQRPVSIVNLEENAFNEYLY